MFNTWQAKFGAVTYTPGSAALRSLATNYLLSSTAATMVTYSISGTCTASATVLVGGGQSSQIQLLSDTAATPTTERSRTQVGNQINLGVLITSINTQAGLVSALIPPGHNIRLVHTGTCTGVAVVAQSEVSIAFGP